VRRVPWREERLAPIMPLQYSRSYYVVVAPGYKNFPVRWMDARFTFTTNSLWDHPVGLRTDPNPRWPIDIMAFGDSFTFWGNC